MRYFSLLACSSFVCLLSLTLTQTLSAQDTISAEWVHQFSHTFNIEQQELSGEGGLLLLEEFSESQFVLIGETHDNAEVAFFTAATLKALAQQGFRHFVVENGRHGLEILQEELKTTTDVETGLHDFYTRETKRIGSIPLPFYSGIEDASFVEASREHNYQLHGIDQEYFYSFPMLFDRLFELSGKSEAIEQHYDRALEFVLAQYKAELSNEDHPVCENLLKSSEVSEFFDVLDPNDERTSSIIQDLKRSWEIYAQNGVNRRASFVNRGQWMKSRFSEVYESAEEEDTPKLLIKMGNLHTMRGLTPLGIYDIGNMVHELAQLNRSQDLNLSFMFRYYTDEEEELGYFDNSEGNSRWLNERRAFMEQGKVSEWTVIDLKAIRSSLTEQKLYVYKPLKEMIYRHDYIIIPPASSDITKNYSE